MWQYLEQVRENDGVTVVVTTHLLDEAERADRIAIMHKGQSGRARYAGGAAGGRRRRRDYDSHERSSDAWPPKFEQQLNVPAMVVDGSVRLEQANGHQWIARLVEAFPDRIESITLGKPTLEDVFIHFTGHRFWNEVAAGD